MSGEIPAPDVKTMQRAIRQKCLDCSGGSIKLVWYCLVPDCALYPLREKPRRNTKRGVKNEDGKNGQR